MLLDVLTIIYMQQTSEFLNNINILLMSSFPKLNIRKLRTTNSSIIVTIDIYEISERTILDTGFTWDNNIRSILFYFIAD
jgi:hypothetical protein